MYENQQYGMEAEEGVGKYFLEELTDLFFFFLKEELDRNGGEERGSCIIAHILLCVKKQLGRDNPYVYFHIIFIPPISSISLRDVMHTLDTEHYTPFSKPLQCLYSSK